MADERRGAGARSQSSAAGAYRPEDVAVVCTAMLAATGVLAGQKRENHGGCAGSGFLQTLNEGTAMKRLVSSSLALGGMAEKRKAGQQVRPFHTVPFKHTPENQACDTP